MVVFKREVSSNLKPGVRKKRWRKLSGHQNNHSTKA